MRAAIKGLFQADDSVGPRKSCSQLIDTHDMCRVPFSKWVGAVCISVLVCGSNVVASADTPPSPEQIAEEIRENFDSLESLHVKWKLTTQRVASIDQPPVANFEMYQTDEYAVKGNKRYRSYWHPYDTKPGAHQENSFARVDGVTYSQILHYDSPTASPQGDNYIVYRSGELDQTAGQLEQAVQYFAYIGSPYYDGRYIDVWRMQVVRLGGDFKDVTATRPFSIVPALRSGQYKVHPVTQEVDGASCWVVEYPGMDKLWLDAERGFALLQREWRWADGEPLMMRYINSDLKQIAPKLWLPQVARREVMVYPKLYPNIPAGTVHFVNIATVSSISVNDVPDSLFVVVPLSGSTAIDNTKFERFGKPVAISYVIGATPERTELSVRESVLRASQSPDWIEMASERLPWRLLFLGINGIFLLFLLWLYLRRRTKGSA